MIAPAVREQRVRAALERVGVLALVVEVAAAHHVDLEEVLSTSHVGSVVRARHVAWTRAHREQAFSFAQLAEVFEVEASTVRAGVYGTALASAADEPIAYWPADPDAPVPLAVTAEGVAALEAFEARGGRRGPGVARKRPRRGAYTRRAAA